MIRVCVVCGINIDYRGNRATRCKTCQKEHRKKSELRRERERLGSTSLNIQYKPNPFTFYDDTDEQRQRQKATIWDNSLNHPIPIPQYRPRKVIYKEWKCGYTS